MSFRSYLLEARLAGLGLVVTCALSWSGAAAFAQQPIQPIPWPPKPSFHTWAPGCAGVGSGLLEVNYGPAAIGWRVCLRQNGIKGIWIESAEVRRPNELNFTKVLDLSGPAEMFVAYNNGPCFDPGTIDRLYDMNPFAVVDTVSNADRPPFLSSTLGTLLGDPAPKLVIETRDLGLAWIQKNHTGSPPDARARAYEVVAWSVYDAGNYDYIVQYGFRNDGTITLRMGATGFNSPKDPFAGHMHNALWFLHFDMFDDGMEFVEIEEHIENIGAGAGDGGLSLAVESTFVLDPETFRTLHVSAPNFFNYHGSVPGYAIVPAHLTGMARHNGGTSEDWTHWDFAVTRWRPSEYGWMTTASPVLPESYVEPSINGEFPDDPVLWYRTSAYHDPHDEDRAQFDLPDAMSGITGIHWVGLDLIPTSFFEYNPVKGISATTFFPLPANCLAWWKFACSPPVDSFTGIQGILQADAAIDLQGAANGGLNLDGVGDWVEIPASATTSYLDVTTGNFTIEMEVRLQTLSAGVRTLCDKRDFSTGPRGYELFVFNGRLGLQLASGTHFNYVAAPVLPTSSSSFAHVAAVVERVGTGTPEVRLYYDGVLVHAAPITGAQLGSLANIGLFRIARAASGEDCIDGVMDEVSFYSRALTAAEIAGIATGEMKAGGR